MATSPLNPGTQRLVDAAAPPAAGSKSIFLSNEADTLLLTVYAAAVTGTLDISAYNITRLADGTYRRSDTAILFPQLTAATTSMLLRRAAITTEQVEVVVTYSAACAYEIYARAIMAGIADTRILGASNLRTSAVVVPTAPTILIPASLSDRSGFLVKNWSTSGDLYVGESALAVTGTAGYPLAPRDALAIDLAAGQAIYGRAAAGTIDVRIAESGA